MLFLYYSASHSAEESQTNSFAFACHKWMCVDRKKIVQVRIATDYVSFYVAIVPV